jgi:uncharacterized protein YuzE
VATGSGETVSTDGELGDVDAAEVVLAASDVDGDVEVDVDEGGEVTGELSLVEEQATSASETVASRVMW